jgi:hypothetical protein
MYSTEDPPRRAAPVRCLPGDDDLSTNFMPLTQESKGQIKSNQIKLMAQLHILHFQHRLCQGHFTGQPLEL